MTRKVKEEKKEEKELIQEIKKENRLLNKFIWIVAILIVIIIGIYFREEIKPLQQTISNIEMNPFILKSKIENVHGYKAKHPVIGIPGYITTALEVWKGKECLKNNFREKIWGGINMVSQVISNRDCWIEHMKLNDKGLDTENIKLRPLSGLESVDYIFPGYYVWARIILELGQVGYDTNNFIVQSYDWRLGFQQLEQRDGYFTRLKNNIEYQKRFHKEKVVIISHSLGTVVWYYFMNWIQGSKWIEEHVEHFINIGGPLLGVSKAASAVISGEMKDTSSFLMQNVLEKLISIETRTDLFRSWPSIYSMLPKGGYHFWRDLFVLKDKNISGDGLNQFLSQNGDKRVKYHLSHHDLGIETKNIERMQPQFWSNPLKSKLPHAPNLKIYCFYGHPKETETGYYYRLNEQNKYQMNTSYTSGNTTFGVIESNKGDGTVPLLSLGYMCVKGWKNPLYNPSNISVLTKEYENHPGGLFEDNSIHFRGNGKSSDHVDIMVRF